MEELNLDLYSLECKRFNKFVTVTECFKCDYLIQLNFDHKYLECGDNQRRYFTPLEVKEVFKL